MCEYAKYNEKGQLICEPKKDICWMCVLGNKNIYNEIKEEENK